MMRSAFVLALCCCLAWSIQPSVVVAEILDDETIDALIEPALDGWRVPGLAVAIVQGDEVWLKGFGYRDLERKLPVTPDTLFVGASTTKAFAAFGAGILVDQGKLDWDTPVDRYLPEFELFDRQTSAQVTLRDMLSHRTGLPRHDYVWYGNPAMTQQHLVASLASLELSQPLRSRWQYNNMMYLTAGYLIESVSGQTWEAFTRQQIFQPLGMTRSNFSVDDMARDKNAAKAYMENAEREVINIPLRQASNIGPAGSINSSARDYARWLRVNLNGGRIGDRQILAAATVDELHYPHITVRGKPEFAEFSHMHYALGWFSDTYRGFRRVQHGGNLDGFTALVTMFPDQQLGSVIFVNKQSSKLPMNLSLDLADRMLGLAPKNWLQKMLKTQTREEHASDEAKAKKFSWRKTDAPHAHPLSEYAGLYRHPGYGDLRISEGEERGHLAARYHLADADLTHWHFEVFNSAPQRPQDRHMADKRFHFRTGVDGFVNAVEVNLEPLAAPIVFAKQVDARLLNPAYLQRFAGRYRYLDQIWRVDLVGQELTLAIPGQQRRGLVPKVSGDFAFADVATVHVEFVANDREITGLKLKQAGGVYDIARVAD